MCVAARDSSVLAGRVLARHGPLPATCRPSALPAETGKSGGPSVIWSIMGAVPFIPQQAGHPDPYGEWAKRVGDARREVPT